jgi:hypothetical protein
LYVSQPGDILLTEAIRLSSSSVSLPARIAGSISALVHTSRASLGPMPKMYRSEIAAGLLLGMSTPATRGIAHILSRPGLSALALLVLGVGADHPHHALAPHDAAVLATSSHRALDFHDRT